MRPHLVIDTWGWITLLNKQEPRHETVSAYYTDARSKGKTIYTTDYILDETFTLLFRRLPFPLAGKAMSFINDAVDNGYLLVEWVTPERFKAAKALRLQYKDKPKISFTDITTMVIMKELSMTHILTDDDHFQQAGMGFKILK